mmetsp:Transcript_4461/g.9995  ORF Transcript_4461/g.9995 Transcript_4461/m.9995 type:complete len:285 (-) Transcript_4461:499-1353(-)
MQLGRDPQRELHVHRVVIRFERLGLRPSRLGVQHGSLDLQESLGVKLTSQTRRDFGTFVKSVPHRRVHDEIEMAVTIPFRNVRETVVLVWQGQRRFGKHGPLLGVQRELSLVSTADGSLGADDIAGIGPRLEVFERLGIAFAETLFVELKLDGPGFVLQRVECKFAEDTTGHDSARHGDLAFARRVFAVSIFFSRFEFVVVLRRQLGRGAVGIVHVGVGFGAGVSHRRGLSETGVAEFVDAHFAFIFFGVILLLFRRIFLLLFFGRRRSRHLSIKFCEFGLQCQ